jgi:hypothetical protein
MRTTLTLDPDVVRMLEDEVHRRRSTFKEIVNDAIRRGLSSRGKPAGKRYRQKVFKSELQPGLDWSNLKERAQELELEDDLRRFGQGR